MVQYSATSSSSYSSSSSTMVDRIGTILTIGWTIIASFRTLSRIRYIHQYGYIGVMDGPLIVGGPSSSSSYSSTSSGSSSLSNNTSITASSSTTTVSSLSSGSAEAHPLWELCENFRHAVQLGSLSSSSYSSSSCYQQNIQQQFRTTSSTSHDPKRAPSRFQRFTKNRRSFGSSFLPTTIRPFSSVWSSLVRSSSTSLSSILSSSDKDQDQDSLYYSLGLQSYRGDVAAQDNDDEDTNELDEDDNRVVVPGVMGQDDEPNQRSNNEHQLLQDNDEEDQHEASSVWNSLSFLPMASESSQQQQKRFPFSLPLPPTIVDFFPPPSNIFPMVTKLWNAIPSMKMMT